MRSLVRVIKLLLVCFYLGLRFSCMVAGMIGINAKQWGFGIGMIMIAVWMYSCDDEVKDWAEKI